MKTHYTTIISTAELAEHLDDPQWAIVDCRFVLKDPDFGEDDYQVGHIPGAVYAHLERDLSNTIIPGVTGRHPWPTVEQAARFFSSIGIAPGVQVVAYDDAGGALAAVRVWWMLRWLGHDAAAVMDGSWQNWVKEGRPKRDSVETRSGREFIPRPRPELVADAVMVDAARLSPDWRVIDVRQAERYQGLSEPIDPVAGHIPGAASAPYTENLGPGGVFLPAGELRQRYQALLGDTPADQVICYCGSGVTSIHSLLAMQVAGLGEGRVYGGSWSDWITNPKRPVATSV